MEMTVLGCEMVLKDTLSNSLEQNNFCSLNKVDNVDRQSSDRLSSFWCQHAGFLEGGLLNIIEGI